MLANLLVASAIAGRLVVSVQGDTAPGPFIIDSDAPNPQKPRERQFIGSWTPVHNLIYRLSVSGNVTSSTNFGLGERVKLAGTRSSNRMSDYR